MTLAVALFGAFVATLGLTGIAAPRRLLDLVTRVQSQGGLWFIAVLRIAIGGAMLLAASASRAPVYLRVLGVLALLSGIATPFVGLRRFEAILNWWRRRSSATVRIWSVGVFVFGLSLVWAVFPVLRGQ